MSKLFSDLKPKNKAQRNGFDLSRRSVFSTKCGQILPVFVQPTMPDGEYRIDVKQLLRTQPLQTAAFTGFSINYDFFFVPHNYSYSSFNEFISQREDSRHVGQPSNTVVPRFSFKGFMRALCSCAIHDYLLQLHYPVKAYEPFSVDAWDAGACHFIITSPNVPWCSVSLEVIRALDMYGYGNYLPLVKDYAKRLYTELNSPASYQDFYDNVQAIIRLHTADQTFVPDTAAKMSWAVFSICDTLDADTQDYYLNSFPDINPTLWPALAYNKAFYEFYRNDYYDFQFILQFNNYGSADILGQDDYVKLFNFDDWNDGFLNKDSFWLDTPQYFTRILAIFCPKNHLYKKDLFTGVLPSTQFGDVSTMITDSTFRNILATMPTSLASENGQAVNVINSGSSTAPSGTPLPLGYLQYNGSGYTERKMQFRFDPALAISVLEQRRADAMQRFKERMLRAGNKVKDVFKAHGWSEPYSAHEATPIFLGTFDGRLDINPVAATAANDDTELGQLGANASCVVNGSKIQFNCHDFGTIVGVLYIIKEAEYDAYGVERHHCLTDPFDYPYPALQNISLAPVDVLELSAYLRFSGVHRASTVEFLGYLPRFMEYKTAVDKVHGEFYSAPFQADAYNTYGTGGIFSDWVTPRQDLALPTLVSFLYQQQDIADNVFKVRATALQSTDQFLINCLFDCMAVEPVSVIGLPI